MSEKEIDEYLEFVVQKMFEAYSYMDVLLANDPNMEDAARIPICKTIRYLALYQEKRKAARLNAATDVMTERLFADALRDILQS